MTGPVPARWADDLQQCPPTAGGGRPRHGISLLEILLVLAILGFLSLLLAPALLKVRENSRRQTCQRHLKTLTRALSQYHDVHQTFPPAAFWDPTVTESLALHRSRRIDLLTQANWALLLLPYLEVPPAARLFHPQSMIGSIGSETFAEIREMPLPVMTCPADSFNQPENRYQFERAGEMQAIVFARGNYALNGGTHHFETDPPTTTSPRGDHVHLEMIPDSRHYAMWGNGIGGINKAFRLKDFTNDRGTLVAFEEIRAGIHPLDPRGVWALGQIGGSITWGHGVNGDDAGPNNPWMRGDDIMNCGRLHESPGSAVLQQLNMPCVDYVDINQQATARSQHFGGVYVSLLDGSVRFLADSIDPGLWHVLHSRETPPEILAGRLDQENADKTTPAEVQPATETVTPAVNTTDSSHHADPVGFAPLPGTIQNSLGQSFRRIRSGSFIMGLPDVGNSTPLPVDCPPHSVTLTRDFWMGTHEVTRSQFQQVLGTDALLERSPNEETPLDPAPGTGDFPATGIPWYQAMEFCKQLSDRPEERQAHRTYRLPTEAEWEYACRAGQATPHLWRGIREPQEMSGEAAGVIPPLPLQPVGSYRPNAWGLFDMRGNVWEWTADWYARDYYSRSPIKDPPGAASGFFKVVRGSDWRFVGETCHIDAVVLPPWKGNPMVGFRIVCIPRHPADSTVVRPEHRHSE